MYRLIEGTDTIAEPQYETLEAFAEAIKTGEIDVSRLIAYLDCGDWFVLDETPKDRDIEIIEGDERDVLPFFFKMLGMTTKNV